MVEHSNIKVCVTMGHKGVQGGTRGYKGAQGGTRGTRGHKARVSVDLKNEVGRNNPSCKKEKW